MQKADSRLLLGNILVSPEDHAPGLPLRTWDILIRQSKRAGLAGRLASVLDRADRLSEVPERPRRHLEAELQLARRQHDAVRWEVQQIRRALDPTSTPIILLKGAAYVCAGLPAADGRLFNDVDIMVPRVALPEVELALLRHGWLPEALDPYDQRYYRDWMHELPPMRHAKRASVLDVHHTILPPTARLKPDPRKLLKSAMPVAGYPDVYVLSPEDMVLHSATHLFHDGELEHGFRDIVDLDALVRHHSGENPDFWNALVSRAAEMDLAQPLFYGLRYSQKLLGTQVPEASMRALDRAGPGPLMRPVMDSLFQRALVPHHSSCDDALSPLARWMLYVRSHYLRMPPRQLIPHLVRKSLKARFPGKAHQPAQDLLKLLK